MEDKHITLDTVLAKIEQADDCEISQIIQAVVRRYRNIFPDWQVGFFSLPRTNKKARREQLCETFSFLMKHE